jgi:hypothetical protein
MQRFHVGCAPCLTIAPAFAASRPIEVMRGRKVHLHLPASDVRRHVHDCTVLPIASVIDQHVDTAMLANDCLDPCAHVSIAGYIHREHDASGGDTSL